MAFKFDKVKGMLVYVQVQEPAKAYQKPGTDPKPSEWKASVVVTDEDWVDEFEEECAKVDAKISLKKVKTTAFEEIYKVAPPEEAGKNVWVLTFRKSTELGKTGKPVPDAFKPRVYEKVGSTLVDVTATKLPGNGSKGVISIDPFERTNGSTSLYLKNVLVTDMIEYVKTSSEYQAGSEFEDELEEAPKGKPAAKPKGKAKAEPDDELEDNIPF